MPTLQRTSRQNRTRSQFHNKRQSELLHLTRCLWIGNCSTRPHNCQVQKHAEVGLFTRRTALCGSLQQQKSDHKVLQNRQWPTSTPKQFRFQRNTTGNQMKLYQPRFWTNMKFMVFWSGFVGALLIKNICHTQRLNPAAYCYKTHPLLIFLQPQKKNKTNIFAKNKKYFCFLRTEMFYGFWNLRVIFISSLYTYL
jgi:hypothetical protein